MSQPWRTHPKKGDIVGFLDDAKDNVGNFVNDAKDKVGDFVEDAKDKVGDFVEDIKDGKLGNNDEQGRDDQPEAGAPAN